MANDLCVRGALATFWLERGGSTSGDETEFRCFGADLEHRATRKFRVHGSDRPPGGMKLDLKCVRRLPSKGGLCKLC